MDQLSTRAALFLAAWGAVASVSPAWGAGGVADLLANQMPINYRQAGLGPFSPVDADRDLFAHDELKTGRGSWATVKFPGKPPRFWTVDRKSHYIVDRRRLEKMTLEEPGGAWLASLHDGPIQWAQLQEAPAAELVDGTLLEGAIFGQYGSPGIVMNRHATLLIPQGTFEYRAGRDTARVRCFTGAVLVGGPNVAVRTGTIARATLTTIQDNALVNDPNAWQGGTVIVTSGPAAGQSRLVVSFDARTGVLQVAPPFGAAIEGSADYALTRPGDFTALGARMETTVRNGVIGPIHRTFSRIFPNGLEDYWAYLVPESGALEVYPGSPPHRRDLIEMWPLGDDGEPRGNLTNPAAAVGNLGVGIASVGHPHAALAAARPPGVPSPPPAPAGGITRLAVLPEQGGQAETTGEARAATRPLTAEPSPTPAGGFSDAIWEFGPYGIGDNAGGTVGSLARVHGVSGRLLADVGGRYERFGGRDRTDITELSLLYRFGRLGDLKVGRQQLYLGPVNNSRLGTLLGLSTTDAVVWRAPPSRRLGWQLGYTQDTAPLASEGTSGWFGRANGPLGLGLWGVTLQTAHRATGDLGASADVSVPLVLHQLNGYAEAGRDPFHRTVATGGLYFPQVYERCGVHMFLEYQTRTGSADHMSLRLNTDADSPWMVIGYLYSERSGRTTGGVGLRYQLRLP